MTTGYRSFRSPLALLAVLLWTAAAAAQTTSGNITGRVVDAKALPVPGAAVTVTSQTTGLERTAVANDSGDYVVANLPPDVYVLRAAQPGFKAAVRSGITLRVDQQLRLDVALELGSFDDVVQVTAAAPLLQTQSAATGEVIEQRQLQDLPLLGRNFLELARLTAGTGGGEGGNTLDLAVNGQREFANSVVVDGIEVTGNRNNDTGVRPSIDAVQEFKVVTSAYAPEFGRAAGGVIAIQTRAGGNVFHGGLSEYYRPRETAARSFFSSEGPALNQHNFGGTLGGPIRRNRTFFFAAYEGSRHRDRFSYLDSVPPQEQIRVLPNGDVDLSALVDPVTGRQIPIFDPQAYATNFFAEQFPGNVIPADRVSPAGLAVLQQLFPAPNRAGLSNGWLNNFAVEQEFEQDIDTFDLRLDHALTDGDRLSFVYHRSASQAVRGDRFSGAIPIDGGGDADVGDLLDSANQSGSLNWTHVFPRGWVVDSRAGYSHFRFDERSLVATGGLADQLGIGNIRIPGFAATDGLPYISLGFGGYTGGSTYKPLYFVDRNLQLTSSLSARVFSHDVKMGGDIRRMRARADFSLFPTGFFYFGGPGQSFTADPDFGFFDPEAFYGNGGSDIADLLLGLPSSVTMGLQFTAPETRSWEGHVYAQDNWRLTSRLTFMYGVRYEYQAPYAEANDRAANFDPLTLSMQLAGRGTNSSAIVAPDRDNVAPRLGVAWQLDTRTVLRGGWGLYYSPENDGRSDVLTKNYPFAVRQDFANTLFDQPYTYVLDTGVPRDVSPTIPPGSTIPLADIPNARNLAYFYVNPSIRTGRAQLFNVVLQREIGANMAAEIGYVGSRSRDMPYAIGNLNLDDRISAAVGRVESQFAVGRSEYDSLQVKLTRRLSQGLSLLAAYTYGQSKDNGPAPFNLGRNSQSPQDPFNLDAEWGPAGNDVRHSFVGSFLYELPFWREAAGLRGALGGWQVNGILNLRSGLPVNVLRNGSNQLLPGLRPNVVGDPALSGDEQSLERYFDTAAFSVAGLGAREPGNAGRNSLRGPGYANLDFSLFKTFRLTGALSAQLRAEAFNLTNTPHFGNPNADLSRTNAGTITGTVGNPRIMQFAARFLF